MTNPTALAFGYPGSKSAETDHWLILVRPKQPTFGSLVLVCKETVQAFSEVSPAAFADLQVAVAGIERLLKPQVDYEKINYLMLMMVDRDVHFHVIPRYAGSREHDGVAFADERAWIGPGEIEVLDATEGNQRLYTRAEIDRLAFIRHTRDLGFSIEAIRELLGMADRPDMPCVDADTIVFRHLQDVKSRIARMQALQAELERMLRQCAGGAISDCRVIEALGDHRQCLAVTHGAA